MPRNLKPHPPETTMDKRPESSSAGISYRSRLKYLVGGLFLLLLPPIPVGRRSSADPSGTGPAEPQGAAPLASDGLRKITFVHVSDIHARYNPEKGGASALARIRGYYEQVKKENPFTLFTNAGDDYEKGSVAEELSRGQATRDVVAAMRYDVRTLGNHDFAWGAEELLRFSHDPHAAVVASNTSMEPGPGHCPDWPAPGWTDFSITDAGGVKIGFFGLVSRPWDERNQQYDGQFYPGLKTLRTDFDYKGRARDIIARHRKEVDLLVLISHLGLDDDCALAAETQGIDLILGGHSHIAMEDPVQVNGTTIIHAGAFAETLGRYDLAFDMRRRVVAGSSYRLVANRGKDIPEDSDTSRKIAGILQQYRSKMDETIALVGQNQDNRAMALIAARAAVDGLKIDAALIGLEAAWEQWPRGKLTRQNVLDAFRVERQPAGTPGQSSLYLLTVRGADLGHAAAVLADSVYYGPRSLHPDLLYTVAIQKGHAFHQQDSFGRPIGTSEPRPAGEVWETVVAYAQRCKAAGVFVDAGARNRKGENLVALLQDGNSHLEMIW